MLWNLCRNDACSKVSILTLPETKDYLGALEYKDGSIEAIYHAEGRAIPEVGAWKHNYLIRDHLGNTRVVFEDDGAGEARMLEDVAYYPFGAAFEEESEYPYTYNGKENNIDFGLNLLDFNTRLYDYWSARFTGVDKIADQFASLSPFNYASNRPVNGIDLHGLQWVHFQQNNVNVLNVNVNVNYSGNKITNEQFQNYLSAASNQFKNVLENSSNGTFTGNLTFNNSSNSDQIIPTADISDFSNSSGIAGAASLGSFSLSVFDTKGELQTTDNFALDFIHELLHTTRLEHPFEITQANDTELIHNGGNDYSTTENTDFGIQYNIMNYPGISIDGSKLRELWKSKPGDKLTMGQLTFLIDQVKQQMQGAGTWESGSYWDYWLNPPGESVKKN